MLDDILVENLAFVFRRSKGCSLSEDAELCRSSEASFLNETEIPFHAAKAGSAFFGTLC
jgi:hypothetical protein